MLDVIKEFLKNFREPTKELPNGAIAIADGYNVDNRFVDPKTTQFSRMVQIGIDEDLVEIEHFVALVNEYKVAGTKIFYTDSQIFAKLDYEVKDEENSKDYLKFKNLERQYYEANRNVLTLALKLTDEAKSFKQILGTKLNQKEMINTLKRFYPFTIGNENLIEILSNLKLQKDSTFEVTSTSESVNISRTVTYQGKPQQAKTEIPTKLNFKLPFYENDLKLTTKNIEVELAIDTSSAELSFIIQSFEFDRVVKSAGEEIVKKIKEELKDIPAYRAAS